MKLTKKLAALVLALMMVFSLMAVTAAAADAEEHEHECAVCCEDEGIMPKGPVGPQGPPCVICGETTVWTFLFYDKAGLPVYAYLCPAGC